jgi:hypothetical protein
MVNLLTSHSFYEITSLGIAFPTDKPLWDAATSRVILGLRRFLLLFLFYQHHLIGFKVFHDGVGRSCLLVNRQSFSYSSLSTFSQSCNLFNSSYSLPFGTRLDRPWDFLFLLRGYKLSILFIFLLVFYSRSKSPRETHHQELWCLERLLGDDGFRLPRADFFLSTAGDFSIKVINTAVAILEDVSLCFFITNTIVSPFGSVGGWPAAAAEYCPEAAHGDSVATGFIFTFSSPLVGRVLP